jgi:hypothetical protein
MSTWHVGNEVRSKIASTGPLGQAWLDELARRTPGDVGGRPAMAAGVGEVEVVVAHQERITLRVGDVFVKLDADRSRLEVEVEAMTMAPVPTPEILWRKPHELALGALPGTALGRLGQPSPSSPAAWAAAGAAVRTLHEAPLPPRRSRKLDGLAAQLDSECEWFTGILDWSEGGQGDALWDLAVLTMGHPEHLGDVVAGYGTDVDLDVVRGWWSLRSLLATRWLVEHGYGPAEEYPEVALLRSQL